MTLSPTLRGFFLLIAIAAALVAGKRVVDSYDNRELFRKDFMQEYALARAVLDGAYPYEPMPKMAARYFDGKLDLPWAHPTPHTPAAAILSVPVGLLDYRIAVTLWLLFELACLGIAVELLSWTWGEPVSLLTKITIFLMSLATGPVLHELWFGQFGAILLVLLTLTWLALRAGRDEIGGALLGLSIALKLTAWPIAFFLLVTNRWRAFGATFVVAAGLHLIAVFVLGSGPVRDYYEKVGPRIASDYRRHDENFSLWTVVPRLVSTDTEEGLRAANSFVAQPLLPDVALPPLIGIVLPFAAFFGAMSLARHCRRFDSAYGILVCASLPVNPVVWDHYLILTAIPIVIVFRRLRETVFPRGATVFALVCLGLTIVPNGAYLRPALELATGDLGRLKVLPFAAGLVTYIPLIPLAGWIGLLAWTDHEANGNERRGLSPPGLT